MTRKQEDFDEFCDPDNPRMIKYEDITAAASRIKPHNITTPMLPSHYQREFVMNLYYKMDFLQKTGSVKGRGALNALELLPLNKKKIGIVISSVGNHAMAMSYYGTKLNIPVTAVLPDFVPIAKAQKVQNLGAKIIIHGNTYLEAQKHAKILAREKRTTYINGRDHPHVLAGYGTVALEILEQLPSVDAVIVPVGGGGLVSAVAKVIKHLKPNCQVYGVQSEKMPVFFKSLEAGEPLTIPVESTLADVIGLPTVGTNAFFNAQPLLDKMLLVNEDWIARAILHLIEKERFVVEGSGACPLAAIIGSLVPELKTKTVVCLLSGGNIDTALLGRCLDRGMAAEGRLVKFRVAVKDNSKAKFALLKLLGDGGYNVVRQLQDRVWVEGDVYTVDMITVCQTMSLEHSLELKRLIERAYPCGAIFETEPFNDRRLCPCYIKKE